MAQLRQGRFVPRGSFHMKKALFALVILAVLGGGATGAYFYFKKPANAAVGESDEHKQAGEAHGGGHGGQKFVELDALILPIVDDTGVTQVVSMVVVIEAAGQNEADMVMKLKPRLKDAYIQELYGVLNKHAALQGGVLQVGMIKGRLNTISHRVLGEGVVNDVLLQVVQQRPM